MQLFFTLIFITWKMLVIKKLHYFTHNNFYKLKDK